MKANRGTPLFRTRMPHVDQREAEAHPSCIACMLIPACRYDTSTLFIMAFAAGSSLSLHLVINMPRRSVKSCICPIEKHAWLHQRSYRRISIELRSYR